MKWWGISRIENMALRLWPNSSTNRRVKERSLANSHWICCFSACRSFSLPSLERNQYKVNSPLKKEKIIRRHQAMKQHILEDTMKKYKKESLPSFYSVWLKQNSHHQANIRKKEKLNQCQKLQFIFSHG